MIRKGLWVASLFLICLGHAYTQRFHADEDIILVHLQDSIYIHETWHYAESFGMFPSNGMIVIKNGKALLIDTPMDNEKTESLVNYINQFLHAEVTQLIVGHFHDDCMGGIEYLHKIGIESLSGTHTLDLCIENSLPVTTTSFQDSIWVDFHGVQLHCQYFGAGHTLDNITVWFPSQKILFGGCLVKSYDSQTLGNLRDAYVDQWGQTIQRIQMRYKNIEIVVPGHGQHGGPELLTRTLDLVKKQM